MATRKLRESFSSYKFRISPFRTKFDNILGNIKKNKCERKERPLKTEKSQTFMLNQAES